MINQSPLPSDVELLENNEEESQDHLEIEEWKEKLDEQEEEEGEEKESKKDDGIMEEELLSIWEEITSPPLLKAVPTVQPKTTLSLTKEYTPFELFELLIGCDLWPLLVQNTNQYAIDSLTNEETASYLERNPESRLHRWQEVSTFDIMKFIALNLSMALEKLGNVKGFIFPS